MCTMSSIPILMPIMWCPPEIDIGACNSVYGADHLAYSMGMQLTSRNEDGYHDLVADTERNNDIVTKINDFFTKNTGYFMWTFDLDPNFTAIKFAADRASSLSVRFHQYFW